ncbi:hypothetical protein [Mycobacterium marseillense]|uniref:hypothetical protein n=1 Tax=Mycobacterium marseillense TaxID=701042 RepID=UPI0011A94432|nr:hypothetical protein [Mycobacterium marseillense]
MSTQTTGDEEPRLIERLASLYDMSAKLCASLAQQLNASSRLEFNEPSMNIAEFDRTYGVGGHPVLGDPLKAAHEMMTAYARSAGEFLWAVGALLAVSSEFVVAPGALIRSVTVHSALTYRLSDPFISPLERCNLCLHFVKSARWPDPSARKALITDVDKWISAYGLGKPKSITQEERLVASMFNEEEDSYNRSREPGQRRMTILRDDNFYKRLSNLVHGDPTTLLSSLVASYEYPVANRIHVLLDSLAGLAAAYKAGNRLNDLRCGAIEGYDESYYVMTDLVAGFREVRTTAERVYQVRLRDW